MVEHCICIYAEPLLLLHVMVQLILTVIHRLFYGKKDTVPELTLTIKVTESALRMEHRVKVRCFICAQNVGKVFPQFLCLFIEFQFALSFLLVELLQLIKLTTSSSF